MPSILDMKRLKRFATERLGRHSALREVLLGEKDEISPADFLARLPLWLALLRHSDEGSVENGVL